MFNVFLQVAETPGASSDSQNRSIGFMKKLTSKEFLMMASFLLDVVSGLSKFTLRMQDTNVVLADSHTSMSGVRVLLSKYKEK